MGFNVTVKGFGSFTATVNGEQAVLAAEVHDASALLASMAVIGPKGDKGDTGAAATIAVGTTSTLTPGSPATVANSGTSSAAVFNFGIPQGETGATGPQGPAGVVAATLPIAYDSFSQTVSLDSTSSQYGSLMASTLGLPTFAYSPQITINTAGTNTILGRDTLYAKWFTGSEVADILGLGTAAYAATGDFYSSANPSGYVDAAGALAAVPDATTTVKGKVELATDAEVIARTDTSRAVTPAGVDAVSWLNSYDVSDMTVGVASTQATVHAVVQAPPHRVLNNATSTAAGSSLFWFTSYIRRGGSVDGTLNFSLPMALMFVAARNANPSTGAVFRAFVGKVQIGMGPGDLSAKGFGVKVDGSGVLQIMAHNGTILTITNTSYTPTTLGYACKVTSDGAGNISCYVNDSLVGTSTGGPTGNSASYGYNIGCEFQQVSSVTTSCRQFVGTFRYSQGYIR